MAQIDKEEVVLGDYVELSGHRMGMVKYIGPINGKKGIFYGVELWKGDGKHNGSYKGKQYFLCVNAGMGVFVSPSAIIYILDVPPNYDPFSTLKAKRESQQNKRSDSKSKPSAKSKSKRAPEPKTNRNREPQRNGIRSKTKSNMKRQTERKDNEMESVPHRSSRMNVRSPSDTKMSVNEFKTISLKTCFGNGDNFDIGICTSIFTLFFIHRLALCIFSKENLQILRRHFR